MKKTPFTLLTFTFLLCSTSNIAFTQGILTQSIENSFTVEISTRAVFPGDPGFNNSSDTDWNFKNDAVNQDTSSGSNTGENPIDPFLFYLVRVTHNDGTRFEIRLKEDAIVVQQDPDLDQLGIFIHLKSDISPTSFSEIGFNDSKVFVQTLNRLTNDSEYDSFQSNLAMRLGSYTDLFKWDSMLINGDWQEEIEDPTPCELAIIDLVKKLALHQSFHTKEHSMLLFDAIRTAQVAFKSECPQRL